MLRLFRMSQSGRTDNGQNNNDNNKENQENNNDNNNNNNNEDEMSAAAASSTSPEEQGDDGTTGTGDLLLPRRIFCPSDSTTSTPSSISTASRIDLTTDVDLNQPKQSASNRRQVAAEDHPDQPYMDCATPLQDVNLYHAKEEKD